MTRKSICYRLVSRALVLVFNGSFTCSFNLIGFLRPCSSVWVLGHTCSYYSLIVTGQCTWLAFFYGMIESALGNLMFLDYHRSLYVPADCSMCISLTSVRVAIFTRASFVLLAQRNNGKEILRNCSYFSVDHGINQSINRPIIYLLCPNYLREMLRLSYACMSRCS